MNIRCPKCLRVVAAPGDVLSEHRTSTTRGAWSVRCDGSGLDALPIAISVAEQFISDERSRINSRLDDISRIESWIESGQRSIRKTESTLAALRKKLAAKGGAR